MAFVPIDTGPIYTETLRYTSGLIVEPWNAASNSGFLLLLMYWIRRVAKEPGLNANFRWILVALFVGWLGGTLYHGLRSSEVFYWLDFIPIYVLVWKLAMITWRRINQSNLPLFGTAIFFIPAILQMIWSKNDSWFISLVYGGLAGALAIPIYYQTIQVWKRNPWVPIYTLLATLCFGLALACRQFDSAMGEYLNQGSHFMWHILGALAVAFLAEWIYLTEREIRPI